MHRRMKGAVAAGAAAFWLLAAAPGADALQAVQIGTFASPVHVAVAPGHRGLLYVVERAGRIQVLRKEVALPRPFLDIADIVRGPPDPDAGGEEGLLSVAFAPDFPRSRRFYVAFTNRRGDIEIDEFRAHPRSSARALRATRRVLLVIPHRGAANHNGGQLQFGPDRRLYISTGDGGNVHPLGEPARRLDSLLGKILRINPLPGPRRPYTAPRDNPFFGRTGRNEIFSYGLRNPWRFSFAGRRILIADVGQLQREEVNVTPLARASGANFGWPQYEGDVIFDDSRPGPDTPTFPAFVYDHSGGRCAIVGGYLVNGRALLELTGRYLYGDLCTGEIRSIALPPRQPDDRPTGLSLPSVSSFGRGYGGTLYVARVSGGVYRLAPDADPTGPSGR